MVTKLVKAGLSIVLAFSIALIPNSPAFAKTIIDLPQNQTVTETAVSVSPAENETKYEEIKKAAESKAATLTTLYGVTSIQYALIDNGNIILSGQAGVYSKDSATPLTNTKMYGIGSISKMFTTAAVMQLVQEGKVNLDTPVIQYIPEFIMEDSRYKDITVRMLLNHSSGLMGSTLGNSMLFGDNDFTAKDNLLNSLKTSRLKAAPGEFSVYCNDGFTLAEILVEKVTGTSFTEYIKNNISDPLGLYNTKTPQDDFQKERLVKTYMPGTNNTLPTESISVIGAGGIYSSAENLCRFGSIFMNNSTSAVIANSSAAAMENKEYLSGLWPQDKDSTLSYGLGWDSVNTYPFGEYGIKALSKGGDTLFYHGNLTVLPEENMAIAVLSSGGSSAYNQVMAQEILLAALKSKGSIREIKPDKIYAKPVQIAMPYTLKQYEGIYGNNSGIYKIEISDEGTLTFTNALAPNSGSQKFTYTGDDKFYYTDGSSYISFVKEKNDITYLYASGYVMLPGLGQTVTDGYQAQKFADNPISGEIKSVWEKRAGKNYFLVNEKYNSEYYVIGSLYSQIVMLEDPEGYCLNAAIIDSNTARSNIQIPGAYGRDLSDYVFYNKGGAEYLKASGSILISEDAVQSLPAKSSFTSAINADGYAHWYKIGKESGNKKIKVTLPENSSFAVYDGNNTCVIDSYVSKQDTVTLPQNGYIVFAGDANVNFTVKYVK